MIQEPNRERVTIPGWGQLPGPDEETSTTEQGAALVRLMQMVEERVGPATVKDAVMVWAFGYADVAREHGFDIALDECVSMGKKSSIITNPREFKLTDAQRKTRGMLLLQYGGDKPFHKIAAEWQDGTDYWITLEVDGCKQTAQFGRDGHLVGDWIV
jgi:hypothetical protein